ncbi:helix-turn-helix domain-containing protein [Salipaludibacillus sp. CUR1]|uniref:helix-turn-helix domain-containing protein n=1 Tax=Salipaludibacillus sp. CUR1 TaxID=2820003 RepID=UPI001E38DC76|nr:helix-turn-helix transcriptional regulator [Salipaludibacillus sp. CUR1]MCE7794256.1 helix-turn-helix domain-containing protein [Salipaludibacillus sp. CUR1]
MLGDMIRHRRKEKGLTLSELSRKTGVSKSYLSYLERNMKKNPSIEIVKRIFLTLDLPLTPLFYQETAAEDTLKKKEFSLKCNTFTV